MASSRALTGRKSWTITTTPQATNGRMEYEHFCRSGSKVNVSHTVCVCCTRICVLYFNTCRFGSPCVHTQCNKCIGRAHTSHFLITMKCSCIASVNRLNSSIDAFFWRPQFTTQLTHISTNYFIIECYFTMLFMRILCLHITHTHKNAMFFCRCWSLY